MSTIHATVLLERILAIVLPVVLILILVVNLTTRGIAGARTDDLKLSFSTLEHPIRSIHESVSSGTSYFVMIFVSTHCPSCKELLSNFDRSIISRHTEGNSRVMIVAPDTSAISPILNTGRQDVVLIQDHDERLFKACKIRLVPSYLAVLPARKLAFRSSSALRMLDWIALETGR